MYLKLQLKVWTSEDYSAACSTWTSKTASGLLPCLWCKNVTLQSSNLHEGSDYLVPVSCPDYDKFDIRTEEDYHEIAAILAQNAHNPTALAKKEKACGFVYEPDTCLANNTYLFADVFFLISNLAFLCWLQTRMVRMASCKQTT